MQTESRLVVVAQNWGVMTRVREGMVVAKVYRVSVWGDENVLVLTVGMILYT